MRCPALALSHEYGMSMVRIDKVAGLVFLTH